MKKSLYFISAASAMLVLLATACSRDNEGYQPSDDEILANAEGVLGVKISSDIDWNMTASARASITVNGNFDETYTVKIYSNDPLVDGKGYVLKRGQVKSGETFQAKFDYPAASSSLIVSVSDSKDFTSYKSVAIADGLLETAFGGDGTAEARATRSMEKPTVPTIEAPYDGAWVDAYLGTAKEPNQDNINDNYDNSYYQGGQQTWVVDVPGHNEDIVETKWVDGTAWGWNWQGTAGTLASGYGRDWFDYKSSGISDDDYNFWVTYCQPFQVSNWSFYGADNKEDATFKLMEYLENTGRKSSWCNIWSEGTRGGYQEVVTGTKWVEEQGHYETSEEGHWVYDETFVTKFKITGTYNGIIGVAASEGYVVSYDNQGQAVYGEKMDPFLARTIVITGTWNVTDNQRIGSGGIVVVANNGTLNIAEGKKLELVNHARLVVLQGGNITGSGEISVTNGNADGDENYNAGTINVGKFNNNFGKFYNYGTFKANVYAANSKESNFYNHGVVHIQSTYENNQNQPYDVSPNARIFNACQWFCDNDMRAYIVENAMGSYFHVGGQLMMSIGNDGTNDPSYVALEKGSLMRLGSLYNNASDWIGPTSGTAVVEIYRINYLNWDFQNIPKHGYFINNIAITLTEKQNFCDGNNVYMAKYGQTGMTAYQKLNELLINGTGGSRNYMGNGGTVFVEKDGANVFVPGDEGFVEGEKGCTPGYNGKGRNIYDQSAVWTYAFEDTPLGDYDMNDIVIKVCENAEDTTMLDVHLCCAGAAFDLYIHLGDTPLFYGNEVHSVLGQPRATLINTGVGPEVDIDKVYPSYVSKPENFSFAKADFWIQSPLVPEGIHIAKTGKAPLGVAIPGDWQWPRESACIKDAYPNFVRFAENVADEEAREWYKVTDTNPVMSKIYVKGQ